MRDEEALGRMAMGDRAVQASQPMLARLRRRGWILCDDITTLDSVDSEVLMFIEVTEAGRKVLERCLH